VSDNEDKSFSGRITRRKAIQATVIAGAAMSTAGLWFGRTSSAAPPPKDTVLDPRFSAAVLNPVKIAKFVDPLPVPGPDWPIIDVRLAGTTTTIFLKPLMGPLSLQVLPGNLDVPYPTTPVWAYRGSADYTSTYLGPTFLAQGRDSNHPNGVPTVVNFDYSQIPSSQIPSSFLLQNGANNGSVVDLHVHGTENNEPEVRFIAHLHGMERVDPKSDGYSENWVTPTGAQSMPPPPAATNPPTVNAVQTHTYLNNEQADLDWYHDHALGITRLNVQTGGAGGYIVTDDREQGLINDPFNKSLPDLGIPLVIQDRMFYPDGRLAYPDLPAPAAGLIDVPDCDPWPTGAVSTRPEYFGDVILVNGKTWPFLAVEPRVYRFRFLNGCNSRVLDLSFDFNLNFSIIGTEGGFLPFASVVRKTFVMGPAERFDALVDFRGFAGQTLTLRNKGAKKPYPKGTPPHPQSDGLVMQFRVGTGTPGPSLLPPSGGKWSNVDPIPAGTTTRRVLLFEGVDRFGRINPLLGIVDAAGMATPKLWHDAVTEKPRSGDVETWEIFNTTADTHPIHIHEVLHRVLNRQPISFDLRAPICGALSTFGPITLKNPVRPGEAYERGFKDTALCPPGEVTRLVVDFRGATPGRFVWHCHILEHEDHEMMRPYDII